MTKPGSALYRVQQIRNMERMAVETFHLAEDELMLRAGTEAFNALMQHYPQVKKIAVFCGGGNNAGDGYVLARLAHHYGISVLVYAFKSAKDLPPSARRAADQAATAGVICRPFADTVDADVELLVDALLGIGLRDPVREPFRHAIHGMNASGLPILALDLPSGLDADTGQILGACIEATWTITFIAKKQGMYLADGPDQCGKIICSDLQLGACVSAEQPVARLLQRTVLSRTLKPRRKNSHKGHFGHVLIIGGGLGMPGAVYLAAQAALRVGAGLVHIATRPDYAKHGVQLLPEVLLHGVETGDELDPLLKKATVCIVGPGLGEDLWASDLFIKAMSSSLPCVVDASALRLLGNKPERRDHWVLTPHPGEAAHLLGVTTATVQADRSACAVVIQQRYGGCLVLKGGGTVIRTPNGATYICDAGNPGMATAGMGDVLSGVIGGLLAQGLSLDDAAPLGVLLHAAAGDAAAKEGGERGLIASDLMPYLRQQVNAVT